MIERIKIKESDFETKFEQLDYEKTSKKLGIEKLAKEMAKNNNPSSNAKNVDHNENKVLAFIDTKAKEANDYVHNKVLSYNEMLNDAKKAIRKMESLTHLHLKYEKEMKHLIVQSEDSLKNLKSKKNMMKKDLDNFKNKHNLEREENSPKSIILHVGILLIILLLESSGNSYFFSKGNELGLLGGAFQAFFVSLINIFFAYFTVLTIKRSYLVTNTNFQKKIYYLSSALIIFIVFLFHLLVGHFRDALNTFEDAFYSNAINSLMNNPLTLQDFDSWLLISLGVFLYIIQMIDIYKIKDPYPGYTDITNKYKEEKVKFEDFKYQLIDEIKKKADDSYQEVKLIIKESESIYNRVHLIPELKKRLENKYKEQYKHLSNLLKHLISEYRSINMSNRESDYPLYFDDIESIKIEREYIDFIYSEEKRFIDNLNEFIKVAPGTEADVFQNIDNISERIRKESSYLNEI